jgi:hypothetical protein
MNCHTKGDESLWWALNGIDALTWAEKTFAAYSCDNVLNDKQAENRIVRGKQ